MPKCQESQARKPFVFNAECLEFNRQNGQIQRSWPASTKSGGFQPLWREMKKYESGQQFLPENN
jgi:hypothetical protein